MSRHHDDAHIGLHGLQSLQRLNTIDSRHPQVEQHEITGLRVQERERGLTIVGLGHVKPFVSQNPSQRAHNTSFVIDDQNTPLGHACPFLDVPYTTGSSIAKMLPRGVLSRTEMCPPWSATMRLTIASPRPDPPFFVVK